MVERRALFATSIFSRVEDIYNLEHNDWLVFVPVLLTDMEYRKKLRSFIISSDMVNLPIESTDSMFPLQG
jgi:hypothetical protein